MYNLYNSIIENLPFCFAYHEIILNENQEPIDYIFLDVNDNYAKFLGFSKKELINRKASDILSDSINENDEFDILSMYNSVVIKKGTINFENYSKSYNLWYDVYAYSPKDCSIITFFYENTEMLIKLKEKEYQNKSYQIISDGLKRIMDCVEELSVYEIINDVISKLIKDSFVVSAKVIEVNRRFRICFIKSSSNDVVKDFENIFQEKIYDIEFEMNEKVKKQCYCNKIEKIDFNEDYFKAKYFSTENIELIKKLREIYDKRIIGITNGKQTYGFVSIFSKEFNIEISQIENFIYFCFLAISRINTSNTLIYSEEKFRIYLESSPVAIFVTEKTGDIIFANNAACELIEGELKNVINNSIIDFIENKHVDKFNEGFEILEKKGLHKFEIGVITKKNKSLDILFEAAKIKEDNYILFFNDITEMKLMERDIIKARNKAISASETKNQFLANMSHEIRTPMNGINGFLTLLEMSDLNNKQKELVDCIKVSSETLLNVINDILDVTNIEAGRIKLKFTEFNLKNCVENIVIGFLSKLNKNVEMFLLIKSDIPNILLGDYDKIKQIFSNIISNAVKFTKKGTIYIEVGKEIINNEEIRINAFVCDTGIGIRREDYDKLFKPFSQVDGSNTRHFGGTGLGLSISKRLVEMMEGEISFESEWGEGSKFEISFKTKIVDMKLNEVEKYSKSNKNLVINLLVKNSYLKKIVKYYLEELGYKIHIYYNLDNLIKGIVDLEKKNINSLIISEYKEYNVEDDNLFKMLKNILGRYVPLVYIMDKSFSIDSKIRKTDCNLYAPYKFDDLAQILNLYDEDIKSLVCNFENYKIDLEIDKNLSVLVVEDDVLSRSYFTRILDIYNIKYDFAENGIEAIGRFIHKEYDIIFMDCQMPVMDGYEATKKIREIENKDKRTYIVAVTANVLQENMERCIKIGMDDYIKKPVTVDTLLEKLKIKKKLKK